MLRLQIESNFATHDSLKLDISCIRLSWLHSAPTSHTNFHERWSLRRGDVPLTWEIQAADHEGMPACFFNNVMSQGSLARERLRQRGTRVTLPAVRVSPRARQARRDQALHTTRNDRSLPNSPKDCQMQGTTNTLGPIAANSFTISEEALLSRSIAIKAASPVRT